jgi:hypothetical protein
MTTFQIKSRFLKLGKYHIPAPSFTQAQIQTSYPPGKNSRQHTIAYQPSTGDLSRTNAPVERYLNKDRAPRIESIFWASGTLSHVVVSVRVGDQGLWVIVARSCCLSRQWMRVSPAIHYACVYTCMYNSFLTMRPTLLIPCAISSLKATTPHQAGNPYPSLEPLDQAAGFVSTMLEPLPVSLVWAIEENIPSKGAGLEEV